MAALTPTNQPLRHIIGDLAIRFYTLAAVTPGDTLQVPQIQALAVIITPTTAVANGATWAGAASGTLITFAGTWAGTVTVISRAG
jgi:hypothetical protein